MRPQLGLPLGPQLEVVVHRGHLPVEQEVGERGVAREVVQEVVEHLDERQAEVLERPVPLAVPVRVGDDVHPLRSGHGTRW